MGRMGAKNGEKTAPFNCAKSPWNIPGNIGKKGVEHSCSKKKMPVPIFLNKAVGLRNENATFLHEFALLYLHIIRKWLTICVFAGLTRKLILAFSNATRCVPTPLTG